MTGILDKEIARNKGKAIQKLGRVFSLPDTMVPDSEVIEQASGSIAASFAASLAEPDSIVADLTAGLGVNTFYFSETATQVYAIEMNAERAKCLQHNLRLAGVENVEVINEDCLKWLKQTSKHFNVAFADPSRRDSGGRIVSLKDCRPDIDDIIPLLERKGVERFMVKASPLLDLHSTILQYPKVRKIFVVEVGNEVKELLIEMQPGSESPHEDVDIYCVRLGAEGKKEEWKFRYTDTDVNSGVRYYSGKPEELKGKYLYEPSPGLMKIRKFGFLAEKFPELSKLSGNTHLFVSEEKYSEFPGRMFTINDILGSSELKKMKGQSHNVISRGHPAKAAELEKRFRLKASDSSFLVACMVKNEKSILLAERVKE